MVWLALVQLVGGQRIQGVVDQGRFAGTGHPGHAGEKAGGDFEFDLFEIVAARTFDLQHLLFVEPMACSGDLDRFAPRQIMTGDRPVDRAQVIDAPLGDDFTAVHAGAGTDIDDVVGAADGVLVMLDDDHRIAEIAQVGQRFQQPLVVTLMQADRRFVEHIHHAHQPGADLAGQPDALRLAAGQGLGTAIQGQVVQADVDQKAQPVVDLLDDLGRRSCPACRAVRACSKNARLRSTAIAVMSAGCARRQRRSARPR